MKSSANSIGYLYVFDHFGNVLPGWPQTIGGGSWTSPITADINNDGQNEIIASSFLPSGSSSGSIGLYVFNPAGSLLKGFPVQLNDVSFGYYNIKAGLSAGDINNDGYKEIIVASSQLNSLWAVDRNGKVLWNSQPSEPWEYNFASVPIIADINNDGKPEILVSKYNNTNQTGKIIVVNNTGQIMESLSCVLPEQIWATPSIGDIEGNGNLELICGSIQGNVFCWDLGVPFDTTLMIWPTYQQNYQRTGSIDLLKTIPAVTHLTEPPNNAVIQPGEITFSWNPVPGALKYNFELSDSISFNDIIFQDTSMSAVSLIVDSVQSSSKGLKAGLKNTRTVSAIKKLITNDKKIIYPKKHLTGLNDGVRYYWRVASLDLIGSSPFSAINSFSTILNAPGTLYALALPSERVVLNWSGTSNNNTGFIIQRKLSTDTIYTVIDTVKTDTISFTDTTLTSINTYNYRIEAYNQIETSAFSNVVTIATLPPYPAAPTLIAPINNASILTGSLYLSWISSANASSYRLQVSTDSTFKTFFLNDSVLTTTTFQVTNLSDGLRYYWRVNSKNVTGISIYSGVNSFSTILNAPQNLSAIAMWGYKVSLTWIGKSNDESGYIIERKLSKDTSYTIIDSLKLKVTSFTDSSLTAVNTYNYRITAYNALGTSGFSNVITVNTITSVENKSRQIPVNYELSQNFPNPFNPITVIEYGLPVQSRVKIVVYNILGGSCKRTCKLTVQSAADTIIWTSWTVNMSSGVYFYKIDANI